MKQWKQIELKKPLPNSEEYVAFLYKEEIGCLKLIHGFFYVEYKGELVFTGFPEGQHEFDEDEIDYFLRKARKALGKAYKKEQRKKRKG